MLGEFLKKMDTQLIYLGIDEALSRDWYQGKMNHLSEAVEKFHVSATHLQNIIHVLFFVVFQMRSFSGCKFRRTNHNVEASGDDQSSGDVR